MDAHHVAAEAPRPKRKYSKTGCKECKRRKMKCDEGKPDCWHCRRLNKECVYEAVKYRKVSAPKRHAEHAEVSDAYLKSVPPLQDSDQGSARSCYNSPLLLPNILNQEPMAPGALGSLSTPNSTSTAFLKGDQQFQIPFRQRFPQNEVNVGVGVGVGGVNVANMGSNGVPTVKVESPVSIGESTSHSESSLMPLDPLMSIPQYFHDDLFVSNANMMAQNLNDLLTEKLEEALQPNYDGVLLQGHANGGGNGASPTGVPFFSGNGPHFQGNPVNLSLYNLQTLNKINLKKSQVPKLISYNMRNLKLIPQVLLSDLSLGDPHQLYLEYFYKDFAWVIVPFQPSETNNPVRDVLLTLASKNAYLMSAVLACGARSAIKLKPSPDHEQAYFSYLSSCLALLSNILNSAKKKLLENVEPLLLTILLLTSDNASSKNQAWRAHLRGAKDLLLMYAQQKKEPKAHAPSLIFVFCAAWYISFEVLAGSGGLPLGGTFDTEEETELLVNLESEEYMYLKLMNIILRDNFNVLAGYTHSMYLRFGDLIKLLIKVRRSKASGKPDWPSIHDLFKLLGELERESEFFVISRSGIVPESHYMHPNSTTPPPSGVEEIPQTGIGSIVLPNGSLKVYCWYDISQQLSVKGSMLTILKRVFKLRKESPYIQELVHEILHMTHFLDADDEKVPKLYHLMMIQSPMWEAGTCCITRGDQLRVERFFRLLKEINVGSAEYVMTKLRQRWDLHEERKQKRAAGEEEDEEDEDDDELDIVTY